MCSAQDCRIYDSKDIFIYTDQNKNILWIVNTTVLLNTYITFENITTNNDATFLGVKMIASRSSFHVVFRYCHICLVWVVPQMNVKRNNVNLRLNLNKYSVKVERKLLNILQQSYLFWNITDKRNIYLLQSKVCVFPPFIFTYNLWEVMTIMRNSPNWNKSKCDQTFSCYFIGQEWKTLLS